MGAPGRGRRRTEDTRAQFRLSSRGSSQSSFPKITFIDTSITLRRRPDETCLRDLIDKLNYFCGNAQGKNQALSDFEDVRKAVELIQQLERQEALSKALGYRRLDNHHLSVAKTLVEIYISLVKTSNERYREEHIASVAAVILQEFVAYKVISFDEIREIFQHNPRIIELVREMSRITRLPIRFRNPDANGRMSLGDIRYNKAQSVTTQDSIWRTRYAHIISLAKSVDALQKMRGLEHITLPENEESSEEQLKRLKGLQTELALHFQDVYLPIFRDLGVWPVQLELQERLIDFLDPKSKKEIKALCKQHGTQHGFLKLAKKILADLVEDGFGIRSIREVIGRMKTDYSIWKKLFEKLFEAAEEQKLPDDTMIDFAKLHKVDLSSIYDVLGLRFVLADSPDAKGNIDHQQNYGRIVAFKDLLLKYYVEVPGRTKDFIRGIIKRGYQAMHVTVSFRSKSVKGPTHGGKCELQIVCEEMEANNQDTHARYKQKGPKGFVNHPSTLSGTVDEERSNIKGNALNRQEAWMRGDDMPELAMGSFISVCDIEGAVMDVREGMTLSDVLKTAMANDGGICRKDDGRLFPHDEGVPFDDFLDVVTNAFPPDERVASDEPLSHLTLVRYIRFTDPKLAPGVKSFRPSPYRPFANPEKTTRRDCAKSSYDV
jgi:hypothetical protein